MRASNFIIVSLRNKLKEGLTPEEAKKIYQERFNTIVSLECVTRQLKMYCEEKEGKYFITQNQKQ